MKELISKYKELIEIYDHFSVPNDYRQRLQRLKSEIALLESQQEKAIPSDEDIENASLDYLQSVPYLDWNDQKAKSAYQQGAKDTRDGNIYVAPKS